MVALNFDDCNVAVHFVACIRSAINWNRLVVPGNGNTVALAAILLHACALRDKWLRKDTTLAGVTGVLPN